MQVDSPSFAKSRSTFLLLLALGATALLFVVVLDFVVALLIAAALACVASPLHRRLAAFLGGREGLSATIIVLLALAIVVVPSLLFLGMVLGDAVELGERLGAWVERELENPDELRQKIEEIPVLKKLIPYQDKIVNKLGQIAGAVASFVSGALGGVVAGTARFFLMLFITLYSMFAFLRHGPAILDWIFQGLPLSAGDRERMTSTFSSVARATLKGKVVIAIVQGGLAGASFAVAGIEGAVFWAAIMAVLSVLPMIGSALIWAPASIYLALNGQTEAAIGVAAWCAIVVGTVDNILTPLLVGRDTEMPDLLVLLTTMGGLTVFGIAGIIIGPVVGALFLAIWGLWGAAVQDAGSSVPKDDPDAVPGIDPSPDEAGA